MNKAKGRPDKGERSQYFEAVFFAWEIDMPGGQKCRRGMNCF
jgi:hypothetical protein